MGRGGSRKGAGRPSVPEKRTAITLALDSGLLALLDVHALKAGISRSEAVNRLLREHLRPVVAAALTWEELEALTGEIDLLLGPGVDASEFE